MKRPCKHNNSRKPRRWPDVSRRDRRGSLTLEAILIIPILLITSLAVLQFGVVMLVEQTITQAVIVAAREAGKGADIDAAAESVNSVLALHGLSVGPGVTFILEDALSTPSVQVRGSYPCPTPAAPTVPAGQIKATLCANLAQPPFFNVLEAFGVSFRQRSFTISAVAEREYTGPPEVSPRPDCQNR